MGRRLGSGNLRSLTRYKEYSTRSTTIDVHGMIIADLQTKFMDPELYRSATTGNIDAFKRAIEDTESSPLEQVSPRGNTVLHVAASLGHDELVKLILDKYSGLAETVNNKGELALHLAASGGHLSTVKSLLVRPVGSSCRNFEGGENEVNNILLKKVNNEGNTALHVALENCHKEVAEILIIADPSVSQYYHENKEEKSPLCIAAQAGYLELVQLMLVDNPNEIVRRNNSIDEKVHGNSLLHAAGDINLNDKLKGKSVMADEIVERNNSIIDEKLQGNSLLHDAITARNIDVLDAIWSKHSSLIKSLDEEGRTPLSFAAYIGYLEGVGYLLEKNIDGTYQRDLNGAFPIHTASCIGHIQIVQEFLKHCPDSKELLDIKGRNILHVAAMFGNAKLVSYILNTHELEMLINEKDNEGNTPLHLATKHWHPKVVSILTWDSRVRLHLLNNKGLTAMDIAEAIDRGPFREKLTCMALKSANAPRSDREREIWRSSYSSRSTGRYNDRVNTLLLVSILVAIVTFAAGFTMPGGFNNSDPHQGTATLVKKHAFHAFLICNAIAMYSSITVAVTLIWAQLGDRSLIITALKFALPILGVALAMLSIAFMAGVYLVVNHLSWLANVVLIMCSIFLVTLVLFLFVPLYFPISSNHYIGRCIFYYYFNLMVLATKSNADLLKE